MQSPGVRTAGSHRGAEIQGRRKPNFMSTPSKTLPPTAHIRVRPSAQNDSAHSGCPFQGPPVEQQAISRRDVSLPNPSDFYARDHLDDGQVARPEAGKCPVDHGSQAATTTDYTFQPEQRAPKAMCPFGFGSVDSEGNSSNVTSLHCGRCKALFYDAAKLDCGHTFCRACATSADHCLKCGSAIDSLKADPYVQDLVDMFITEHTSNAFLEQQQHEDGGSDNLKEQGLLKADFYMEIGLQSMRGGNFSGALSRLETCRSLLVSTPHRQQNEAEIRIQLGAVCGSQGDCLLRLGDMRGAVHSYEASIHYLDCDNLAPHEVQQTLTVTQNKLGDLWYSLGKLESARTFYCQALQRRKALYSDRLMNSRAKIDYALSLAKLADIEQAMEHTAESDSLRSEAVSLSKELAKDPSATQIPRLGPLLTHLKIAA